MMASTTKMATSLEIKSRNEEIMETDAVLEDGEISEEVSEAQVSRRFDLFGDLNLAVPKEELDDLYTSLGIDEETERHFRFNELHLRGMGTMRTDDVLEYFSGLEPVSVRWLGDGVCNVKWYDEIKPARALLYLSAEIRQGEVDISKDCYYEDQLEFTLPAGRWRKGVKCEKSDRVIMRYSSKDDRLARPLTNPKKRSKHKEIRVEEGVKNPWGEIAQTWGKNEGVERQIWSTAPVRNLPDLRSSLNNIIESRFTDVFLQRATELRRTRPRSPPVFLQSSSESSDSDSEFVRKRKLPKMHADREEERIKLARMEAVIKGGDLRSRLNQKKQTPRTFHRDPAPSDESDLSTDWATENYTDLRRTLINKPQDDDLDSELSDNEPGEILQIQVDNEYYKKRPRD